MKASIESTDVITTVDGLPVRVWKGMTANGVPFIAFVARCDVEKQEDDREFQELVRRAPPRELQTADVYRAFSTRML